MSKQGKRKDSLSPKVVGKKKGCELVNILHNYNKFRIYFLHQFILIIL